MSKKFEQLLEYVVNEETEKAQAMFHEIVVAKSREIYENLIVDETEEFGEEFGGDEVEGLVNEIEAEETADVSEEEEGMDDMVDSEEDDMGDDMGDEMSDMGDEDAGEEHGMEDMEDRLVDLEDALSQLKAEFDDLMSNDAEGEDMGDEDEMGGEEAMGDEEMADEMDENAIYEYSEHAAKPVLSDSPGNAKSPVAKNAKSPVGGEPVKSKDGSEGNHGHGSKTAPKPGKLTDATTKPKMSKVQDMKKV